MTALAAWSQRWRASLAGLLPTWTRLGGWASALLATAFLLATGLALDWWYAAHGRLMASAPHVRVMNRLSIALSQDRPVVIGRSHLGQAYVAGSVATGSAAAVEQFDVTLRVPDPADASKDRVEIRNRTGSRRLWLNYADGFETFAERFEVPPASEADTRFMLGAGATITLRNVSPSGFEITTCQIRDRQESCVRGRPVGAARSFSYTSSSLRAWFARVFWFWLEPAGGATDSDSPAAHLGGRWTDAADRPMQIALDPVLDWQQLRLVYRDGRLFLAPGRDMDRATFPITMQRLKPGTDDPLDGARPIRGFPEIVWPAAPAPKSPERSLAQRLADALLGADRDRTKPPVLSSLIAGRTSYAVTLSDRTGPVSGAAITRRLDLRPTRKVMLYARSDCPLALSPDALPPDGCPAFIATLKASPAGCADLGADPVKGVLPGLEDVSCAAKDGLVQQWGITTPVAGLGTGALLHLADASAGGDPVLVPGAAGGWREIAISKWLPLAFALSLAFLFRPRGSSDLYLDAGTGAESRFARLLRGRAMRTTFVVLSLALALAPEMVAMAARYGDLPRLREGLNPVLSQLPLVLNWGLAGLGLVLFSPATAATIAAAWLAVTVMAAIGALTLASLAIDGPTSHWATFFLKHRYLFLDVVPPFAVTIAVIARARARRAIRAVLLERSAGAAFARIAPPLVLFLFFALWAWVGSQTGIGGFQPIEAGKFVSIILIAAVVAGLVGYAETVTLRIGPWERFISLMAFTLFTIALLFAPYVKSDFSPVLIVLLLGATVGLIFTGFAALRVLWITWQRRVEGRRLPLVFRPRTKGRLGWPLMSAAVIGLAAFGLYFQASLQDYAIRRLLHVQEWADPGKGGKVASIIDAMGQGRHVPAQRFITWYDLGLDKKSPRPEFRGAEFHLIRSRTEVAYGNCVPAKDLDPKAQRWGPWMAAPLLNAAMTVADGTFVGPLCKAFHPPRSAPEPQTPVRRLGEPIAPIEIPLAENDFTPAYMLARYGVGLGVALFLAQALLVLTAAAGLVRILLGQPSGRPDAHFQQFLGVMLTGSTMLYIIQWMLSWSNILGLLPIMGQPMTWISSGNSHHLLMALPCMITILLTLKLSGPTPQLPYQRIPPDRYR